MDKRRSMCGVCTPVFFVFHSVFLPPRVVFLLWGNSNSCEGLEMLSDVQAVELAAIFTDAGEKV